MFAALGRSVYRWRRPVAIVAVGIAVLFGALATDVADALGTGGWIDTDSESYVAAERLAVEFGSGGTQVYAVYTGGPGMDAQLVHDGELFDQRFTASRCFFRAHQVVPDNYPKKSACATEF